MLYTASIQDESPVKHLAGEDASLDERLNDLLLPLVKGYGSEKSYDAHRPQSLQCYGGCGYLQDYPIEQYVRDSEDRHAVRGHHRHPGAWTCSSARSSVTRVRPSPSC